MRVNRRSLAVLLVVVTTSGCGLFEPAVDLNGDWQLATGQLDGRPFQAVRGHSITLAVAGGRVAGNAGCNSYGGPVAVRGSHVTLGDISQTAMACLADGVGEAEATYLTAFRRVTSARRDGEALILSGEGMELRYLPR